MRLKIQAWNVNCAKAVRDPERTGAVRGPFPREEGVLVPVKGGRKGQTKWAKRPDKSAPLAQRQKWQEANKD